MENMKTRIDHEYPHHSLGEDTVCGGMESITGPQGLSMVSVNPIGGRQDIPESQDSH